MLRENDIFTILKSLSKHRLLFHSEADFQHALAWEIRALRPELNVRLEVPLVDPVGTIDLLVLDRQQRIGIELKFGRGPLACSPNGEAFRLAESPPPVIRYEFLQDLERLEAWTASGFLSQAFVLCLSNHPACWETQYRPTTQDQVRFHDGKVLQGMIGLDPRPRSGSTFPPIKLRAAYMCQWRDYSQVDTSRYGQFRFLLLAVIPTPLTPDVIELMPPSPLQPRTPPPTRQAAAPS